MRHHMLARIYNMGYNGSMAGPHGIGPRVRELLLDGWSNRKIRRETGCGSATVSYHAGQLGISTARRPTYDWSKVAVAIRDGASFDECRELFGCTTRTFYAAINAGKIPRPARRRPASFRTPEQLAAFLMGKSGWGPRGRMKKKLLDEKVLEYRCAVCGLDTWMGQKLPLRIDHIDGDGTNYEIKNFRLLCGNCDSLQDTFCHKNIGKKAGVAKSVDAVDLKSAA
jgi:hypothetical protein